MTKEPLNITHIRQEYIKKYKLCEDIECEHCRREYPRLEFLTQKLREAMEEIIEGKTWTICSDCKQELNQNITNFFKE